MPDSATLIRTEVRRENVTEHWISPMMNYDTWDSVEYALYEVPVPEAAEQAGSE